MILSRLMSGPQPASQSIPRTVRTPARRWCYSLRSTKQSPPAWIFQKSSDVKKNWFEIVSVTYMYCNTFIVIHFCIWFLYFYSRHKIFNISWNIILYMKDTHDCILTELSSISLDGRKYPLNLDNIFIIIILRIYIHRIKSNCTPSIPTNTNDVVQE